MDSEEQSDTFKDKEAETNQMPKYINQALDRSIDKAQKQAAKAVSITYIVDILRGQPIKLIQLLRPRIIQFSTPIWSWISK